MHHLMEHGLLADGWSFGFNNRKRALGICNYNKKRIELSRHTIEMNTDEEVIDTILHEVAHAIAGHEAGHGPKWKEAAKRLGAKPKASTSEAEMPIGRWNAVCRDCGAVTRRNRHRRTNLSKRICSRCKGGLSWIDNGN
jgi:predicted SprT family Zn-dependent metalloprotease